MAENPPASSDNAVPDAPVSKSASPLTKLKIPLFVAVVIVVECLVAYLYLPSSTNTEVMAEPPLASKEVEPEQHRPSVLDEEPEESSAQVEVDLGEFNVTAFQPTSNTTLRIVFHLFGTIAAEDQEGYVRGMEENRHRFREQVLVTVRSAEITDLTDAGLGLIKRTILEKTNRILGKPILRSVVFSDFSFIEQ